MIDAPFRDDPRGYGTTARIRYVASSSTGGDEVGPEVAKKMSQEAEVRERGERRIFLFFLFFFSPLFF